MYLPCRGGWHGPIASPPCNWVVRFAPLSSKIIISFLAKVTSFSLYPLLLPDFLTKVTGIDLAKEVSKEVVELIKQDVRLQRNLIHTNLSLTSVLLHLTLWP